MNGDIILKLGIALTILVSHSIESKPNYVSDTSSSKNGSSHVSGESPVFYQGVEGTPGVDFPIFSHIPRTVFSCKGLESGYYADLDTDCQVFHICEEEKKISFLCPNGTIFQQSDLICEWWFKVNCSNSPNLFEESVEYLRNEEPKRKASRRVNSRDNHGAVLRREETSSVSVKRTGEEYDSNKFQKDSTRRKPNLSNHDQAPLHSKNRRFNDDQTGNYLNNLNEKINYSNDSKSIKSNSKDTPKTTKTVQLQKHAKEYHVQFPLSSTGTDSTTYAYDNQNHFKNDDKSELKQNKESFNFGIKYDSDETQITQESSSFTRNSFNSIREDKVRFSTVNPYPNHRTTYSDLKTPNLSSSKALNTISSVTPQYITTQPLNNGKPFLGSRVGVNITARDPLTTLPIGVDSNLNESNYVSSTTQKNEGASKHKDLTKPSVERNNKNVFVTRETANSVLVDHSSSATDSIETESATESLTFVSTNHPLLSSPLSTVVIQTGHSNENSETQRFAENLEFSPTSHTTYENRNVGFEAVSTKIQPQKSHSFKTPIAQALPNKQLTHSGPVKSPTKNEHGKQSLDHFHGSNTESTTKTIDYATIYGSYMKTNPTKPTRSTFGNSIQIKFDDNANKVGVHLTKSITGTGIVAPQNSKPDYGNLVYFSPSSVPLQSNRSPDEIKFPKDFDRDQKGSGGSSPVLNEEKWKSSSDTTFEIVDSSKNVSISRPSVKTDLKNRFSNFRNTDSITTPSYSEPYTTAHPVLYVLLRNSTQKPKPFGKSRQSSSFDERTTHHSYKISTASPFKLAITPEPTLPTPFTTAKPTSYGSVDNMMNILKEIYKVERDYPSENSRPGLVIPPSVGPQTLHTLAVYFENALDQIVSNKKVSPHNPDDELNKEKLTHLLTEMTRYGYGQLFRDKSEIEQLTTEKSITIVDENDDLRKESSNSLVQSSKIRELAKNFTSALSSFLNDPDMFRRDLEDLRPTEPPLKVQEESKSEYENIRVADEELLNFSDSDSKLSLPAIFSTTSPPSPTWSYILATKATNEIDFDNSLNPDLNTADTQSFVPNFNSLNVDNNYIPSTFPHNHWTTSPSATKLWRNTFSINPAIVNDHLETTVTVSASDNSESTEEFPLLDNSQADDETSRETRYELRTLPKVTLNSTEVHGLLVDFMNTTNKDSNILYNILTKLNITEDAFLSKMREIESNPLTRRLILLLISECGKEATRNTDYDSDLRAIEQPLHDNPIQHLVHPTLTKDNEDTRALQLLNALYSIASKFSR